MKTAKSGLVKLSVFFGIFSIGVLYVTFFEQPEKPIRKLPIINPGMDVNRKLMDSSMFHVYKNHIISDFKLLNQEGESITQNSFDGKIYIANFFFTTCPTICPKMTKQMKRVYAKFKDNNEVALISHTVLPDRDSVPVLKAYAQRFEVEAPKWNFVTGDKQEIYNLARKSYCVVELAKKGEGDIGSDFIHTENVALIDKKRRIRGYYDGTSLDEMNRLIKDIELLLDEK